MKQNYLSTLGVERKRFTSLKNGSFRKSFDSGLQSSPYGRTDGH